MLTIQEAIQKINRDKQVAKQELDNSRTKAENTEIILEFFTKSFAEFVKQILAGNYDVKVKFPEVQKIKGSVSVEGLSLVLLALDKLSHITKQNKLSLPDIQKIEGTVKVSNPTAETKIPPYPKQIKSDITSLPKYVSEKLDKVADEIKKIEVSPVVNVQKDTPKVEIDLNGVKKLLEEISERINMLEVSPTVVVDTDEVKTAVNEVRKSINNLQFPVPSFKSSWSHSLTMRSEDLDKTYTWTTDGGKDVIDTITVKDEDGSIWKREYTYDGSGKVLTESKWTRV